MSRSSVSVQNAYRQTKNSSYRSRSCASERPVASTAAPRVAAGSNSPNAAAASAL